VSQTTWLLNLGETGPRFAMLLDYFPVSAGRRGSVFTPGEQFAGELLYYPARAPLRAVLVSRASAAGAAPLDWPGPGSELDAMLAEPLLAEPWALDMPILLPAGRLAVDGAGQPWWRAQEGGTALPLAGQAEGLFRGTDLIRTAAIWSGSRLEILAAQTPWGRIGGND